MDIRLIKQENIDKVKWNSCVHYAHNGNVFGYKWFLDHVAKDWDGLVEGDYESVFPLVWRKGLWGGKVLYQPDLMRELGMYTINAPSQARVQAFLKAIPSEYKQLDIVLNEQNNISKVAGFQTTTLTNHQLLLAKPFETLEATFSPAVEKAVEKAVAAQLVLDANIKPEAIAAFYKQYTSTSKGVDRNFHTLQRIMYNVLHRGWGFASAVRDQAGSLLAVNFFIYSHGRVISLLPLESPAGQKLGALIYLFYMLIRTQANRPLVLDFNTEQSNEMATTFGALPNPYLRIQKKLSLGKLLRGH
ncbi:MAG: hypothetical protein R2828_17695 [Saprospiraceae bacterium]